MATPPGSSMLRLRAANATVLLKQADHPEANSCSGLEPMRAEPGVRKAGYSGGRQNSAIGLFPSTNGAGPGHVYDFAIPLSVRSYGSSLV
jgi:hypothetical protein